MKYISRVDNKRNHFWRVRFSDPKYHQSFSDGIYGSTEKALKAARKYRATLLKELGLSHYLRGFYAKMIPKHQHSRNTSGIIGVNRNKDNRGDFWYWVATFQHNGRQVNRRFSIIKLGEKEAFRLACQFRFENSGPLYVYRGSKLPGKIPVPWEYI